jgi:ABC-type uncharacterized transport system permease subunit
VGRKARKFPFLFKRINDFCRGRVTLPLQLGLFMTGTIINVIAIIVGSILGLLFGARLSDQLKSTIISGLGLFLLAMGL